MAREAYEVMGVLGVPNIQGRADTQGPNGAGCTLACGTPSVGLRFKARFRRAHPAGVRAPFGRGAV